MTLGNEPHAASPPSKDKDFYFPSKVTAGFNSQGNLNLGAMYTKGGGDETGLLTS